VVVALDVACDPGAGVVEGLAFSFRSTCTKWNLSRVEPFMELSDPEGGDSRFAPAHLRGHGVVTQRLSVLELIVVR
jgi:hypothetical protein